MNLLCLHFFNTYNMICHTLPNPLSLSCERPLRTVPYLFRVTKLENTNVLQNLSKSHKIFQIYLKISKTSNCLFSQITAASRCRMTLFYVSLNPVKRTLFTFYQMVTDKAPIRWGFFYGVENILVHFEFSWEEAMSCHKFIPVHCRSMEINIIRALKNIRELGLASRTLC